MLSRPSCFALLRASSEQVLGEINARYSIHVGQLLRRQGIAEAVGRVIVEVRGGVVSSSGLLFGVTCRHSPPIIATPWSAPTCRRFVTRAERATYDQSGDKSPHSRETSFAKGLFSFKKFLSLDVQVKHVAP